MKYFEQPGAAEQWVLPEQWVLRLLPEQWVLPTGAVGAALDKGLTKILLITLRDLYTCV